MPRSMGEKYDEIGVDYNLTRRADPYLLSRFQHYLNPQAEGLFLDIGCGTGNYTIAMANQGTRFIGIDPSSEMLDRAKARNDQIEWKIGKAENLPLGDACVDGIMASLTIHHWIDLEQGFRELYRIAKPGCTLVIFTATPKQMTGYWLNHYFPKMLKDSMMQMPTYEKVEQAISQTGFELVDTEKYNIRPDLADLFLYSGKHHPGLYLKEQVRNGISSFSHLAHAEEVAEGLMLLKEDVATGKINDIIFNYRNDMGDYLFMVGRKPN
ncbi:MAG: class I SAM-dependent methyltransferase [Cyclobacteriaceae bacterium]